MAADRAGRLGKAVPALFLALALLGPAVVPGAADDGALEHFEKRVRPLLAENCYSCHSANAPSVFANLRLDSRAGLLRGGDSGPVVVPGNASASLLLRAVRGQAKALMPPTGQLSEEKIADLAVWVDAGAQWPDEQAPGLPDPSEAFDLERRRREHWAWRPVIAEPPPAVSDTDWPQSAVDRFILAKLESAGLDPAPAADRYTLLRRLSFAVTGLPPTPAEIAAFVADDSPRAVHTVVERLLASPHFGERWARHWMDLFRYTESHGSEGDPDLPDAWRYRDYLIRALNADVPYDQLIREHIAGDLLPQPRLNSERGLNESLIGTANYRMIEHGFQPVDPWEDRVKWTDNQIDVVSKAFQGLTVSCARCHDHKFDAISQRDYYALFGLLASARPVQRAVDAPDLLRTNMDALRTSKAEVKDALAALWLEAADSLPERLQGEDQEVRTVLEAAACDPESPLHAWFELSGRSGAEFRDGWRRMAESQSRLSESRKRFNQQNFQAIWRPGQELAGWERIGTGLESGSSAAGEFSIVPQGDTIVEGVYAPGVYSGLLSRRHNGVLQTPRFKIDTDFISFLVQGSGFSVVRLIVENYAVPRSGIYWQRYSPKRDEPVWEGWSTKYWKGFSAYLEFATMQDSTNFHLDREDARKNPRPKPLGDGRSHFGALAVAFHNDETKPRTVDVPISYLLEGAAPGSPAELAGLYASRLREAIHAWRDGSITPPQVAYLDAFVRLDLLPASLGHSERLDASVQEYRRLEDEVPIYRRAPSVLDEEGPDQRLLVRGSHKDLGDPIPRRYLEALGSEPYSDPATARLRLANEIADAQNPLTARVMVNRVWAHLFGHGLVSTVDNFGRVGSAPSHPELLDYLADRFVKDGWSIKQLIRRLVLTSTYQADSEPSHVAASEDPGNTLWQHMPLRRLEGEAIRDSLLAISGRLEPGAPGPSINVYYAFAKGKTKGDREKGPLDGQGRRSVYQEIRRNAHNPFLEVFDQPKPSSTRGTRDVTNVPAQSLTMLNSPLVISQAQLWGKKLAESSEPPSARVKGMFLSALGRPPAPQELDRSLGYLGDGPGSAEWADLAHSIFNLKEFLYVR
ncbi:MAG: PSD1 and planctomycete cytochrome C domain-containing protein [Bryobacterales bacterium]|nr:PSD1 and planctomycete cytochrome C domain-containing protein [Bryobacterales bacterium]